MTTFDTDAILNDLHEDGDVHKLEADGDWTFTLHIDNDDALTFEDLEDPEVFGRIEPVSWRRNDYGHDQRPDGFTGAARKFASESTQGDVYWYEPPADFRRFKGSGFADVDTWRNAAELHFRHVRSVVSWGYVMVGIKVRHVRPDGYERRWSQWIGAVENPIDSWGPARDDWNSYVHTLVEDILVELTTEIQEAQ